MLRILCTVLLLSVGLSCDRTQNRTLGSDHESLEHSMQLAGKYLAGVTGPEGRFDYRVSVETGESLGGYNLLRHAGTMYSMCEYVERSGDEEVKTAVLRAATFLQKTLKPIPGEPGILGVWSEPGVIDDVSERQCKLGGVGLGLVALAWVERIAPGTTSPEKLEAVGDFALYLQREDGSFYDGYNPKKGGRSDRQPSIFYPGEVALGLALLYRCDGNTKWLQAASDALLYLARRRNGQTKVPSDHWALLASQVVLAEFGNLPNPPPREVFVEHVRQLSRAQVANFPTFPDSSVYHGTLINSGSSTATATRVEGLTAALRSLDPSDPLVDELGPAVTKAVAFLQRCQIKEGPLAGGIPGAIEPLPDTKENEFFNTFAREIRIDYVQHALSGMLGFVRWQEETQAREAS